MYGQTPITPREARLAKAVTDASAALAKARTARNAYIRERMSNGANASDLARKFDISRESLYKMLRTHESPPAKRADPARLDRLNQLEGRKR
jgi:Helix-turn-helix domain of resolvase